MAVNGPLRVSSGQAAANALAAWLRSQMPEDVTVIGQWPEPDMDMFAPTTPGGASTRGVVSITKVGKRERVDAQQAMAVQSRVNLTLPAAAFPNAKVGFRVGFYVQPIQVDIWATSEDSRDDLIDRCDDAFNTGAGITLGASGNPTFVGVTDDPVRDGVLVPLLSADGYSGAVECILDEPDITDVPETVQRASYRATYFGRATGEFVRTATVPRMIAQQLKAQLYESPTAPPTSTLPYSTTTVTVQANVPPPGPKVTHGTST